MPAVHNINLDPLGAAEVDMAAAGNCTCCMVDGAVRERMLDVRVSSVRGALVIPEDLKRMLMYPLRTLPVVDG